MTAIGGSGDPADALDVLLAALRRPLEFVAAADAATAARTVLPGAEFARRARDLAAVTSEEVVRRRLEEIAGELDELARAEPAERAAAAERCLATANELRRPGTAGPVVRSKADVASAPAYKPWTGDMPAALEALSRPVQFVRGVGPRRAAELARMGISTVADLLFHLPFRYEDRRRISPIGHAVVGLSASFIGELVHLEEKLVGRARRPLLQGVLRDDTGLLGLAWFNRVSHFQSRYRRGQRLLVYGCVEVDAAGSKRIVHPEVEPVSGERAAGIVPVYNKPGSMSVRAMRKIVRQAVADSAHLAPSVLPAEVAAAAGILDLQQALAAVHRPPVEADLDELGEMRSVAHRSLIFDELFYLQLGLALRRRASEREPGLVMESEGPLVAQLQRRLPFALTTAQMRVIDEIAADMARAHPMHRLVQGDVGSGKTVVALHAALIAVQSGFQAALMAPTELLAEQHHATIARLVEGMDVRVALLTGDRLRRRRDATYAELREGRIDIAVGTHALIQDAVAIPRLGLGIVDEQHRFGVLQRAALRTAGDTRGEVPDILLMTATPIPRTLAMTVYGDLDISMLDELPAGRQPITTHVVHESQRGRVYATVRREVKAGRQAYVVYPLVESSDTLELRDATTMAVELARTVFPGFKVGLVHGKMKADEKEAVMRRFRDGVTQILVSTTVVEVGVDVPNASVMVVEHAERFGLSQLHQLRGRVGRGGYPSYCLLITSRHAGGGDEDRLAVMRDCADGFAIAEADLRIRGPGEFLGTRQSGMPDFRVANLLRDARLLNSAREAALDWLDRDPELASEPSQRMRAVLVSRWADRLGLADIG